MSSDFQIRPLDRSLAASVQARIDGKTKPLGALGRLEALALQTALVQGTLSPRLNAPHLLLFAGDHGAAREGISAYPQDVTWQMVLNFLGGGAAINVFTRQAGIAVRIVDAGVNHDFGAPQGLIDAKIAFGTGNFIREPAMTGAQCYEAIDRGAAILRATLDLGANVMGCGEMGIGNTGSAALLVHRLTRIPLQDCVGRGTGLDDPGLARKLALLTEAFGRCPGVLGPRETLAEFGGFEIAMMVGAFLAGAEARMILIVDGFIATAALIVAAAIEPTVLDYAVFAHGSAEQGHRRALDHLGATPLLDLGLRLGEGTGVPLAYPLLQAAVNFLKEMASFAEAGIASKSEG